MKAKISENSYNVILTNPKELEIIEHINAAVKAVNSAGVARWAETKRVLQKIDELRGRKQYTIQIDGGTTEYGWPKYTSAIGVAYWSNNVKGVLYRIGAARVTTHNGVVNKLWDGSPWELTHPERAVELNYKIADNRTKRLRRLGAIDHSMMPEMRNLAFGSNCAIETNRKSYIYIKGPKSGVCLMLPIYYNEIVLRELPWVGRGGEWTSFRSVDRIYRTISRHAIEEADELAMQQQTLKAMAGEL